MMPLRPYLLDLREHPLSERRIRLLLTLEEMTPGDTLLVVSERNPDALLEELKPVLEKSFTYWIAEAGPETWRILISCEESIGDQRDGSSIETGTFKEEISLNKYIAEMRSLWGDGKDPKLPFKVRDLLENLLTFTRPQESWIARLIRQGLPARELYRDKDDGFILMGHVHEKGHRNPPHDHGPCWVLYGVYHGVVEITTYRRTDDGKVPGRAMLQKEELRRLTAGVVIPYLPGETHSTFAVEHSVVFRLLSGDLNKVKRYRYDLEKGTVSLA
jgi:uncharacterized protein (DUF2249 family)